MTDTLTKIAGDVGYIRARVDVLVKNSTDHESRLKALEKTDATETGERRTSARGERIITALIASGFTALTALTAAYIDRQPTGVADAAVIPTQSSDIGNRSSRPAGGR